MNTPRMLDFPVGMAWGLAWLTLALVAAMVLGLLLLRAWRWRREPQLAAFEAHWQPVLLACIAGEAPGVALPSLRAHERWPFMKLWLHSQMSVHGPGRERLAALGLAMGCREMALSRLHSSHSAERLVGMLALGFLRDARSVPELRAQLTRPSHHGAVYAGRALLEIDATAHADAVAQALLQAPGLDLSLASVLLKPFRAMLGQALQQHLPALPAGDASAAEAALRWLRLADALKLQLPLALLAPFLTAEQDIELLMAAMRLYQGEQGADVLTVHAQHPDWRVRAQLARALAHVGSAAQLPLLARLAADAQWWVRYRATQALLALPGLSREQIHAAVAATGDRYAQSMLQAVLAEQGEGA